MNTILVWILITVPSNGVVSYSPPFADLQTCELVKKQVKEISGGLPSQCIQIRAPK